MKQNDHYTPMLENIKKGDATDDLRIMIEIAIRLGLKSWHAVDWSKVDIRKLIVQAKEADDRARRDNAGEWGVRFAPEQTAYEPSVNGESGSEFDNMTDMTSKPAEHIIREQALSVVPASPPRTYLRLLAIPVGAVAAILAVIGTITVFRWIW